MEHPAEADLALYAGGDLPLWPRLRTSIHVNRCSRCRALAEEFRQDRTALLESAVDLPEGLNWDRLSAEMTANIHLGLEAGECVTPREGGRALDFEAEESVEDRRLIGMLWRPLGVAAAVLMLLGSAWWLNMPESDNERLARAFGAIFGSPETEAVEDSGPMVEASANGIELRENGSSWGINMDGADPVETFMSMPGSASASYVDDDTGQVMITTMYTQ